MLNQKQRNIFSLYRLKKIITKKVKKIFIFFFLFKYKLLIVNEFKKKKKKARKILFLNEFLNSLFFYKIIKGNQFFLKIS